MHAYEALRVDPHVLDQELRDQGAVGPELAHLANSYCDSPRALVFRQPSSEWRLFMVMLPLASRLSLMGNPIFSQLARAWGLNIRFIGVDRNGLVYDFRSLLSDKMLSALIQWLSREEVSRYRPNRTGVTPAPAFSAGVNHTTSSSGGDALDILFATLARDMLTILDKRRDDWGRHLDTQLRLEPGCPASLFDRASRYPDFLRACHDALRNQLIDVRFYGRVLRSVDLREHAVEQRAAAQIDDCLDPATMAKLTKSGAGKHLGCYNWLSIAPRHASMRAHILQNLPAFAGFFAESLLPIETWQPNAQSLEDLYSSTGEIDEQVERDELHAMRAQQYDQNLDAPARRGPEPPAFDLKRIAAGQEKVQNLQHVLRLKKAIDAGQDRAVIASLADRFQVAENTIRLLWRDKPASLGQPPTWHLVHILKRLNELGRHDWPKDTNSWAELMAQSVPSEAI